MKLLQRLAPPLLTLLLAAAAVLLPPALSQLRDSLAFSGVHVEEETVVPAASELSVTEKLELVCLSRRDSSGAVQISQSYGAFRDREVLQSLFAELEQLRKTGLFPVGFPADLQETLDGLQSMAMITYTDSADLSRTVSFWQIMWITDGGRLLVTSDIDTGKIYEYSYSPNLETSFAAGSGSAGDSFGKNTVTLDPTADVTEALRRYAAGLGLTLDEIDSEKAPHYFYARVKDSSVSFLWELEEGTAFSLSLTP